MMTPEILRAIGLFVMIGLGLRILDQIVSGRQLEAMRNNRSHNGRYFVRLTRFSMLGGGFLMGTLFRTDSFESAKKACSRAYYAACALAKLCRVEIVDTQSDGPMTVHVMERV